MFQQHSDIEALASQGIAKASDGWLRDISGKIRYEQTKMNEKLVGWYPAFNCEGALGVNYQRPQTILDNLQCLTGCEFDVQYARTMVGLLEQSKCAADLAIEKATRPQLRDQARIVSRSAYNEINALNGWLSKH
jgi:uncharacterized protein (DUF305 family)